MMDREYWNNELEIELHKTLETMNMCFELQ